jgi:peptidoglycan hydrolase-like protein with peptidoglycan-binding domain
MHKRIAALATATASLIALAVGVAPSAHAETMSGTDYCHAMFGNAEEMLKQGSMDLNYLGNLDNYGPVHVLQCMLNEYNHSYNLVEDGDFGSGTKAALVRFQTDYHHSLSVDGVAGPATWSWLDTVDSSINAREVS